MAARDDLQLLSADWRHRDQLTWQMPAVMVAVSGGLMAAAFQLDELHVIRVYLLWAGGLFSGLVTVALGQNIYYQRVASDLIVAIQDGNQFQVTRVPKRRTGEGSPGFLRLMFGQPDLLLGSYGLYLFAAGVTGFFGFLLSDLDTPVAGQITQDAAKLVWWAVISVAVILLTVIVNRAVYARQRQPAYPLAEAPDVEPRRET